MKIVFGADTVPTKESEQAFKDGNAVELFTDVLPIMKNADRVIINLECALTETDGKIKKFGPNLKAHPDCVNGLKNAGVTDIMLANNHVFDYGVDGLVDTVTALRKAELPYTGVGNDDTDSRKIYYIEEQGKKIAIVNVCEHEYTYATSKRMGANPFDPFLTMRDVREAKCNADHVIVVYHGGKEHVRYPSPRLRNLCQEFVINGADAVLCQHSHCIGCYECYEGGHILYGQGNFHFAKSEHPFDSWFTSLLVELTIKDGVEIAFYPLVSDGSAIALAKGEKYDEIMQEFYARNEELKNGKWQDGWRAFCQSRYEQYANAIFGITKESPEEKKELFAHYLDCEAHSDVCRELFYTWNATNDLKKEGNI